MPWPHNLGEVSQEHRAGAPAGCCDMLGTFIGVTSALSLLLGVLSASGAKPGGERPAHPQGFLGSLQLPGLSRSRNVFNPQI